MIRQIHGKVLTVSQGTAIIDVCGWGVMVRLPVLDVLQEGSEATLHTHLAIRQDGVDLYGFSNVADLRFFELCLSVSGVGPKTALSFLARAPRPALESAIAKRDIAYLTRVAGLGKKAAEKLVVELADKMIGNDGETPGADAEVFDMLVALGYTEREARRALMAIPKDIEGKQARLRAALSHGG